jgi:hypothetical protein
VLSERAGQPGFTELSSIHTGAKAIAVAALKVKDDKEPNAAALRDAEAECVADTCSRLIGNVMIRDEKEKCRRTPLPARRHCAAGADRNGPLALRAGSRRSRTFGIDAGRQGLLQPPGGS